MTGIYDRIHRSAAAGDKLSVNLFHASFILRATGNFTDTQILNALNTTLANNLAGTELTDMTNIATQMDLESTIVDKLVYASKLLAVAIAIEEANMSDADFRTVLGIV